MRKTIATIAAALCLTTTGQAQNFIDHLQKDERGSGSVSVKQSEDISKLVNGGNKEQNQAPGTTENKPAATTTKREEPSRSENQSANTGTERREQQRERTSERRSEPRATTREEEQRDKERREQERKRREAIRAQKIKEAEENAGVTATNTKKLMSNSKRVTGYRVQVFAGGNTRNDRAQAQEMGAKLKTQIPGEPIYVHFYSPRWCCRCGNFLNQEDATKMMKRLTKLGYKNACVVKTTITVNNRPQAL